MNKQEIAEAYKQEVTVEDSWRGTYKHLMYCPFTGLGLYDGFRGNRWLKSRIKIFKQFVIPSLQAQTSKDFTLWISWRPQERYNGIVKDFVEYLETTGLDVIHTYAGVCFYDDKYPQEVAHERLLTAIHGSMSELVNATEGEVGYEWVLMTIQPSDDVYYKGFVKDVQQAFKDNSQLNAIGFEKGYLMNYQTKELAEWNPKTNPPFYTIKFFRPDFINPLKHAQHTALKHDVGQYKIGTPLPSHEYVKDCLAYGIIKERGFLVGTHGANISTVFDHPYKGERVSFRDVGQLFGLESVEPLKLPFSLRGILFGKLPYKVKRKLRYLAGEKQWILRPLFSLLYNGIRS